MRVFRHGDVIFREVKGVPMGTVTKVSTVFEQHGETGKLHAVKDVRVVEIDWNTFLTTPAEGGVVTHPEHPSLRLPPNTTFTIERVRSITPYMD